MTLIELVNFLKIKYKQTQVKANIFDFETRNNVDTLEPKYFFRGENKKYETTKTTLSRLQKAQIFNQNELDELFHIVYTELYLFIRSSIWKIPNLPVEKSENYNSNIEISIVGLLQHYEFETKFLDLTSDIEIAAYFSSMNKIGGQGRIFVVESNSLNYDRINYYFDLTKCPGTRPKKQSSYVIWDQLSNLNLKDSNFLAQHNGIWFDFTLDSKSKEYYFNKDVLSTKNDPIVFQINEWWSYSDIKSKITSTRVLDYIDKKINKLNAV